MTEQQRACVEGYVALLNDLLSGKIELSVFEATYLQKFKLERIELPEAIFEVLDRLYGDVDAYCADPEVRGTDGIGEAELLSGARRTLVEVMNVL